MKLLNLLSERHQGIWNSHIKCASILDTKATLMNLISGAFPWCTEFWETLVFPRAEYKSYLRAHKGPCVIVRTIGLEKNLRLGGKLYGSIVGRIWNEHWHDIITSSLFRSCKKVTEEIEVYFRFLAFEN